LTIVGNVLKAPDDVRFRTIRRSNKLFARTVGAESAALELLDALGFAACGDELRVASPDMALFWMAQEACREASRPPQAQEPVNSIEGNPERDQGL